MKACLMDWGCECGVTARDVPLIGLTPRGVPTAAIASHQLHCPCPMILSRYTSASAIRLHDHWFVKLSTPKPSVPNPKREPTPTDLAILDLFRNPASDTHARTGTPGTEQLAGTVNKRIPDAKPIEKGEN